MSEGSVESVLVAEEPKKRTRKGRAKGENWMKDRSAIASGNRPLVPDDFDPDKFNSLKEGDFENVVDFKRHRADVYTYKAQQMNEEADYLNQYTPEEREAQVVLQRNAKKIQAIIAQTLEKGFNPADLLSPEAMAKLGLG